MPVRTIAGSLLGAVLIWGLLYSGGAAQLAGTKPLDEDVNRISVRIQDFLAEVAKDNGPEGVDILLTRSPLLKDPKRVALLKESIRREMERYGVFLGMEPIQQDRIGRSVIHCTYLYHCLDFPVIWTFTFYRAEDEGDWALVSLQFHVDYDKLAPRRLRE